MNLNPSKKVGSRNYFRNYYEKNAVRHGVLTRTACGAARVCRCAVMKLFFTFTG